MSKKASAATAKATKMFKALKPWQQAVAVLALAVAAPWTYKRALTLACLDMTNVGARFAMGIVRSYSFDGDDFFNADGCSNETAAKRKVKVVPSFSW